MVSMPGCNLQAHKLDQLTSRQQGKLAVPTVPAPADNLPPFNAYDTAALDAMTGHNPAVIFFEQEKQRVEAKHLQSLRSLQLKDDEEEQYHAAIAASLAVTQTTPHLIGLASSSQFPSESGALVSPILSIPCPFPLAPRSMITTPAAAPLS